MPTKLERRRAIAEQLIAYARNIAGGQENTQLERYVRELAEDVKADEQSIAAFRRGEKRVEEA